MHLDVVVLRDFYYGARLGALAQRRLQGAIRRMWPSTNGMVVAGYGFAAPLLRPFNRDAARVISMMPAQQGVIAWPREGPNASVLVEPNDWPLRTGFLDRLVLAHALEFSERPGRLLEECWRALAPEGRLILVAPNRSGLWARRDATPFGFGRPYSFGQLDQQLAERGFAIARHEAALYFPPSERRFWLRAGMLAERVGQRLDVQRLAGVLLVEAVKRVAAPKPGLKERAMDPLDALGAIIRPAGVSAPSLGRAGVRASEATALDAAQRRLLTKQ